MDPTAVLILGVLWFLFNLLSGVKKKPPQARPRPETDRPPRQSVPDATQREGSRLESVLRDFQRALEEAESGPLGRQASLPLPEEEDIEERASLESEPTVVSLEEEVRRPIRQQFTQDEDAESLVARRITAATIRDAPRTRADHTEFDERIRKEPADQTATRGYTMQQLRDAVIWREILGSPVSERRE